jgi:hypothetical protein
MIVFKFGPVTERDLYNLKDKPYFEISIPLKTGDLEWLKAKHESLEIIPMEISKSDRISHRARGLIVGIKEHVPVMEVKFDKLLENQAVTMFASVKYCTIAMEIRLE